MAGVESSVPDLMFDPFRLKIYYDKVFPINQMFKWLSYGIKKQEGQLESLKDKDVPSEYFYFREFSFTLEHDVYVRYLCFQNSTDFKTHLVDKTPFKIDMGAVYNIAPCNHSSAG